MDTSELKIEEAAGERRFPRDAANAPPTPASVPAERWGALLAAVVICGLVIAAIGLVSFDVGSAARLNARGFDGFLILRDVKAAGVPLITVAQNATDSVNPVAFLPALLLLAVLTSQRRRPLSMLAIAVVLLGSVLSSVALKAAIGGNTATKFGVAIVGGQSFPSDHAAAGMALVLCVLLASPREWSGLITGVGALYVLLEGYGSIMVQGHLPSDVVGGYLMAGLWALIAVAGLRAAGRGTGAGQPSRPRGLKPAVALCGVFALAVLGTLLAVTSGPDQPAPRAFVTSAVGIALVAVVLIYVFARFGADLGFARRLEAGPSG